jgi:tRNA (mo5U34)-methyltransferase
MPELEIAPSLATRVAEIPLWYHSLELPGGIVTPGTFDTLDELARIPFPASLDGKRCLDIGTADGFWAFEMERRGASEVVAIDVRDPARQDWPGNVPDDVRSEWDQAHSRRSGFDLAHEALESSVQWRELRVDELDPELVGEFDFVFMGSLLLHIRDPVAALAAIARVLRGELLSVDAVSPPLTIMHPGQPVARFEAPGWPLWWKLNVQAYRRLFEPAGLETLASGRPFFVRPGSLVRQGSDPNSPSVRPALLRRVESAVMGRLGVLHAWVRARALGGYS